MAQISVIVPVYKVEQYLQRCANSVLSQTFEDLELILVDDGSPDGSPAICDDYAGRDSRVHVIHQKNGGLSAARNAGIDYVLAHSQSSWIIFLDSDDWIHPRTLEVLLNAAVSLNTSVSLCGYVSTEGSVPEIPEEQFRPELQNTREFYREETILLTTAWAKLYKKELLREFRYPVGKLHEDEFTTYRVLFTQESLANVPAPLYFYFANPESITKSGWTPRRLDVWEAFRQQIQFFDDQGDRETADICFDRYLHNAYIQLCALEKDPGEYGAWTPKIKAEIRSLLRQGKKRKSLDFEKDFPILNRFYPVRTRLELYARAIRRRLGRS